MTINLLAIIIFTKGGNNMIEFGISLSKLNKDSFQGAYIGKIKYEIYCKEKYGEYFSYIEKENKNLVIIVIEKKFKEKLLEKLNIYLVNKRNNNSSKEHFVKENLDVNLEKNISFWRKISKEEVYKFSKLTGDENYIHLTNKPVVQGMFLLNEVIKGIDNFKELEIKFINPIFADEEIFLQKGERSILAYSNNKLCFKIIFK